MAIDNDLKKMAMMEWCSVWEPGLPFVPGDLGQNDQQILLWGNPDVLWGAQTIGAGGHTMNDLTLIFRD